MSDWSERDTVDIAVTAIYIRRGLGDDLPDSVFDHHGGHIGLDADVATYAILISDLLKELAPIIDWPGVFDYEVSELFGEWLRHTVRDEWRGSLPTLCDARPVLITMIADFFSQSEPEDDRRLRQQKKASLIKQLKGE